MDSDEEARAGKERVLSLLSDLPDKNKLTLPDTNNTGDATPTSLHHPAQQNQAGAVIAKIEDMIVSLYDDLLYNKYHMIIRIRNRTHTPAQEGIEQKADDQFTKVHFPSRSDHETRRFNIFYQDPTAFGKQDLVDRCVDDLAYTFGVEREALNIVAAVKGLVAGAVVAYTRVDNVTVDFSTTTQGELVPNVQQLRGMKAIGAKWVLVIEKEATFRTLASSKYYETSLAGKGIIITAKGYPDLQTRAFIFGISRLHPEIPIYALVDFDPDGIAIMTVYKHGSLNLAHEARTAVPSIKHLGVGSQDVLRLQQFHASSGQEAPGTMKLTARDRRAAVHMLLREEMYGESGKEQECRRELQTMLMLNLKAEIQSIGDDKELEKWLDEGLMKGDTKN